MLDIMRRQKRLKLVLWVVILALGLGMLLFFVPGGNVGDGMSGSYAAQVDDRTITVKDFHTAYMRTVDNFTGGRGNISQETLRALGVPGQVLDGLIANRVVEIIADRLGVKVTPAEIRRAIETNPIMMDQGKFVGVENYKRFLAANRVSIEEFEEDVRYNQILKKVRAIITDPLDVSDTELRNQFSRENQKTVVDYVVLKKDDLTKQIKPTEADLRAYFESHKENYRIPEKRRAEYLLVRVAQMVPSVTVSEQELQEEWSRQSHEETVEAAHILFKVEDPSKEAAVRARAEAVLKQAKSGADFGELAKKNSDDAQNAPLGGYLGPFTRGRMVEEFERAAFALKPGEISDLVRTEYGFHIIKVTRHEVPTFEANRERLAASVQMKKAQELAKQKAEQVAAAARNQKDLASAATGLGFQVEINQTGLFDKNANPGAIGLSQPLRDEIFQLKEINSAGKAVEHLPLGYAVPKLLEVQMAKPGEFTLARNQVESEYIESKAKEMVQAEAKKLSEEAIRQGSLEKAAKAMGYTVKTSEPFAFSGTPGTDVGSNPQFNQVAFDLQPGAVSSPVALLDNAGVLQVRSRSAFDEAEFQRQRPQLRERLLQSIKDPYFEEYVRKVTDELIKEGKIEKNPRVLEQPLARY